MVLEVNVYLIEQLSTLLNRVTGRCLGASGSLNPYDLE